MPDKSRHVASIEPRRLALRGVLITLGITVIALIVLYLLRNFAAALLLIFAGILFGIFLNGLTNRVTKWLHLPRWLALTLILLFLLGCGALFGWLVGPQVVRQTQQLGQKLPESVTALQNWLKQYDWGRALVGSMPSLDKLHLSMETLLGSVTQALSITTELFGGIVFVFFVGLYLAASPNDYFGPVLLLLSPEHQPRGREVLAALGQGLGWWLFGRVVTMVSLGI
ncbi:MAG TPA: AI-2E family transporter, partial [Chthoniobacterales bacterium]|nr:AI-2E family transporter [Chthoniobacterales bacterium]